MELNNVIDCWASILNYEERKRSKQSPYRLYMHTGVMATTMLTDRRLKDSDRVDSLKDNLKTVIDCNESNLSLKKVDIVMFPMLESNHYYLNSFDLKDTAIEVLDNMHPTKSFVGVTEAVNFHDKNTVLKVKDIFVKYLESIGHKKCEALKACNPMKKV